MSAASAKTAVFRISVEQPGRVHIKPESESPGLRATFFRLKAAGIECSIFFDEIVANTSERKVFEVLARWY